MQQVTLNKYVVLVVSLDPIQCNKIVAYYIGNFEGDAFPINSEFQVKVEIDWSTTMLNFYVEDFNYTFASDPDQYFHYYVNDHEQQTEFVL